MGNLITDKIFIETDFEKWRIARFATCEEYYSKNFPDYFVSVRPIAQGWYQLWEYGYSEPIIESNDKTEIIEYLEKIILT